MLAHSLCEKSLIAQKSKFTCGRSITGLCIVIRHAIGLSFLCLCLSVSGILPFWLATYAVYAMVLAAPFYGLVLLYQRRIITHANQYLRMLEGGQGFLPVLLEHGGWMLSNELRTSLKQLAKKSQYGTLREHELLLVAEILEMVKRSIKANITQKAKQLIAMARNIQHQASPNFTIVKS